MGKTGQKSSSRPRPKKKRRAAPGSGKPNRARLFAIFLGGAAAIMVLALVLDRGPSPKAPVHSPVPAEVTRKAEPRPVQPGPTGSEYGEADIDQKVKLVDYTLLQVLGEMELGPDRIAILDVRRTRDGLADYLEQTIRIDLPGSPEGFTDAFSRALGQTVPEARLAPDGPDKYRVSIEGEVTHHLLLPPPAPDLVPPAPRPQPAEPPVKGEGRLVIVIDDMGEDVSFARHLADLPFPVTFAIWPRSSKARAVAQIARAAGRDIIIHQPMEPRGYPKDKPGPGSVFTSMDSQAIRAMAADNLDRVPDAIGMNNHMGSRFTEDARGMNAVLEEVSRRGLFFLDSATTQASVVEREGRKLCVPILRRDVFLDNVRAVPAILHQLRKAEKLAARRGEAIAIGHPAPETLAALAKWHAEKTSDVAVTPISRFSEESRALLARRCMPGTAQGEAASAAFNQ